MIYSGHIGRADSVVAVLTGHLLKDPDYVNRYHNGTLSLGSSPPIKGAFANRPERVAAKKSAILESIERRNQTRGVPRAKN
jgi:threonine synthase